MPLIDRIPFRGRCSVVGPTGLALHAVKGRAVVAMTRKDRDRAWITGHIIRCHMGFRHSLK